VKGKIERLKIEKFGIGVLMVSRASTTIIVTLSGSDSYRNEGLKFVTD